MLELNSIECLEMMMNIFKTMGYQFFQEIDPQKEFSSLAILTIMSLIKHEYMYSKTMKKFHLLMSKLKKFEQYI